MPGAYGGQKTPRTGVRNDCDFLVEAGNKPGPLEEQSFLQPLTYLCLSLGKNTLPKLENFIAYILYK